MSAAPPMVTIDAALIHDWDSFHDAFAEAFDFPSYYGRNMDAWIDCITWLDVADYHSTLLVLEPGTTVTLLLENVDAFRLRCPEQYAAIVECTAFVNWRRLKVGEGPVLALAFA